MESPSSQERRGRAEVSVVKLDVVGPLLAPSQIPRSPPVVVVNGSSLEVVLPDVHAQHTALRANWENHKHAMNTQSQCCRLQIDMSL